MPDFSDAGPQKTFDVIPSGTIATLHLTVRPGQAGEGGWLRRSKDGASEGLDCEFTLVDGPYAKRKFWTLLTLGGTTTGHTEAREISRSRIRAILESARGVKPSDTSEAARNARHIENYGELDGMRFIGRIGVEPARGSYPAKNTLLEVITPDRQAWRPVEQVPNPAAAARPPAPSTPSGATPPATIVRPQWG
jgi:hypothetical protein